ncbi:uncharacterized protein LOC114314802 isoform X1 [Camellia sinensis]|uniref:uncharacterized protein LOC114314802 isoform X1 n=2 Tax=Camellia sinensis TaxID=4442 RepID=UPI001035D103|nr:uncharacterized protein LOC114314802 isoform X1 [Camellia sinensis]XP_028117087.1 uncharacterized protein LOC114314802 isoform X1 [Camellia sinensis]
MNCSIFSEVPKEPMVSMKSGLLYEKRLIERHISAYNEAKTNISCKHSWDAWNVPNIFSETIVAFIHGSCQHYFYKLEYGKCPITGEPLSVDDIVPIKTGVRKIISVNKQTFAGCKVKI